MSNKMKRSKEKYLVMGGDSVIGRSLYNELLNRGCEVYYTTRRNTKLLEKPIKIDFNNKKFFYWMSSSAFRYVLKHNKSIVNGFHRCGPSRIFP